MTTTVPRTPVSANATASTANEARPRPRPRSAQDQRFRTLQLVLFAAGAVLMPLGILAVCLGWYGSAHSHYEYDQNTYLISGGILGLGLTFFGGFLYFGAWLARLSAEQRDSARQLTDAMLLLAGNVGAQSGAPIRTSDGAIPVLAGEGTTVHRRDCALIAHRDDLRLYRGDGSGYTICRVCRPEL